MPPALKPRWATVALPHRRRSRDTRWPTRFSGVLPRPTSRSWRLAVQANPGLEYMDVASPSTGNVLARAYIPRKRAGGAVRDHAKTLQE